MFPVRSAPIYIFYARRPAAASTHDTHFLLQAQTLLVDMLHNPVCANRNLQISQDLFSAVAQHVADGSTVDREGGASSLTSRGLFNKTENPALLQDGWNVPTAWLHGALGPAWPASWVKTDLITHTFSTTFNYTLIFTDHALANSELVFFSFLTT